MGTIWENELSLQYFLRSCKFVNLGSNYTNQQQVLNQGVQAPDLWCGWLPAWFGRSQVPSCVASEQFQIQPGIPCSFPLLAFKQNLPRFPEPGISGFPELFTRCTDFQISSLTGPKGTWKKKYGEIHARSSHTPVLQFWVIIHLLLWISDIFFFSRKDAEKDGCQNNSHKWSSKHKPVSSISELRVGYFHLKHFGSGRLDYLIDTYWMWKIDLHASRWMHAGETPECQVQLP